MLGVIIVPISKILSLPLSLSIPRQVPLNRGWYSSSVATSAGMIATVIVITVIAVVPIFIGKESAYNALMSFGASR